MKWQQKIHKFWSKKTCLNDILLPFSFIYYLGHLVNFHILQRPKSVRPMVLCVGNAVVGGAGKTPFAIALANKLIAMGLKVAFITRGYGSIASRGEIATLVKPSMHTSEFVGDEALLLARIAPTYVSSNRHTAAMAAEDDGARVIIMDDGLQNNTLRKNYSFLVLDENYGLGNGYPMPAGPLREPYKTSCAKADTAVLVTQSKETSSNLRHDIKAVITPGKKPEPGQRYFAFCGIANPQKFLETLKLAGFDVAKTEIFYDHYPYTEQDIQNLIEKSDDLKLITTEKDFTKIDPKYASQIEVLPIELQFEIPESLMYRLVKLK